MPLTKPRAVAVVTSEADLARVVRLRRPPDAVELRLDALRAAITPDDPRLRRLSVPIIITARHPLEGGAGNLRASMRLNLLRTFLPLASYVDVELRFASALRSIWQSAAAEGVGRIMSVHALDRAPTLEAMRSWARDARAYSPDIFKIAVRTDTPAELDRLLRFFEQERDELPISAMGIGKLGSRARIALARRGSALIYSHLGRANVEGQLSLADVRRLIGTELAPSSRRA